MLVTGGGIKTQCDLQVRKLCPQSLQYRATLLKLPQGPAILGGLGSPTGALVGGLILGAMEGLIPVFLPVNWVPVIEFVLFVLILLVRPSGLFGAR